MKEALESIVQKEALSYTFVHNLFYEYLTYADDIERQVWLWTSSLCCGLDKWQSFREYFLCNFSLQLEVSRVLSVKWSNKIKYQVSPNGVYLYVDA